MYHGRACRDEPCPYCESRAEERAAGHDEPLSPSEEARLDNWAEKQMEANWL